MHHKPTKTKLEKNNFTHRHMRTKYLIFLGKWHQNRRLSGHNTEFSGLIIWDIFMMRYFQVSWDSNFNLNRLKTDFVGMFGPIRSELNCPGIGLAPLRWSPSWYSMLSPLLHNTVVWGLIVPKGWDKLAEQLVIVFTRFLN